MFQPRGAREACVQQEPAPVLSLGYTFLRNTLFSLHHWCVWREVAGKVKNIEELMSVLDSPPILNGYDSANQQNSWHERD